MLRFDRILAWLCARCGYVLMRPRAVPRHQGWHYPPLREPRTVVSWSTPDLVQPGSVSGKRDWKHGKWSQPDG